MEYHIVDQREMYVVVMQSTLRKFECVVAYCGDVRSNSAI